MKKFLLIVLAFFVFSASVLSSPSAAKAQADDTPQNNPSDSSQSPQEGTWYDQGFWDWHQKVYGEDSSQSEIFGERYTAAQVQWVLYGIGAQIIHAPGPAATVAIACVLSKGPVGCISEIKNAVESLGDTSTSQKGIASVFDSQPLSGIGYVRQKINNFSLIPEAKAQGVGFSAANPVQTLWSAFRNLTFGLMVVVVLAMAFMIMFRVKISPQAIITVQSALPKIAGALVLITFSYAIAGFVIDLMYVVVGMLASFLASSNISSLKASEIFSALNTGNIILLTKDYLFYFFIGIISASMGLSEDPVGQFFSGVAGGLLGYIILIIAGIVLFFAFFKILWLLLKTYATLLLQIALGPIQILLGTITPFGGFGAWIKGLAANLAVYPVVGFMYVLAFFFLAQGYSGIFSVQNIPLLSFPFGIETLDMGGASQWSPPMTMGGGSLNLLWLGASLVVMSLIPKSAEIIQGAISGKPFAFGSAVGEAVTGPFVTGLKTVNIATDVAKAWTTRLGTRNAPSPAPTPQETRNQS